jgi:hypothetical protein
MNKFFVVLVALLAGYFFFIKDSHPKVIFYNNLEYGPSQLDRSNDSNSQIFKYYSKAVSNKDYISILYPDPDTGSLNDWSDVFSSHFEKQGFTFTSNGFMKTGVKNTVTIFMMPSTKHNVVFMYILENNNNFGHLDKVNVFTHLESIVLD